MKKFTIEFPQLRQKDITTVYAQSRPYRKNGYRIEMQKSSNKYIYHNYGHGGSGVSLSYGSALQIFSIFKHSTPQFNKQNKCLVLGAGIIGLTTALVLSENGQKVKIFSDKIPSLGQKNNNNMITSQVAPGFWFPYDYINFQPEKTRRIAKNTYDYLSKSIKQNKFKSVKYAQVYQNYYPDNIYDQVLQKEMKESFNKIQLNFLNGQKQVFNNYRTIKIDMQLWLHQLIQILKSRGVQFVKIKVKNLQQVVSFKQKYIFNCLGNETKQIFNDNKMQRVKGHLIQFKNPDPSKFNYIFGTKIHQGVIRIYCHNQRIIIGLTSQKVQDTIIDKNVVNSLLKRAQNYFNIKNSPKAKL